jgi:hypothetical protein
VGVDDDDASNDRRVAKRAAPLRDSAKIEYEEANGRRYAIRDGYRFEIESELDLDLPKAKRQEFKPKFVQVPTRWVEALERAKNINTYRLAHKILAEAFRCDQGGGEIVLSAGMTRMTSTSRHRAAMELERFGLIKLVRLGKQALRVILI